MSYYHVYIVIDDRKARCYYLENTDMAKLK